MNVVSVLATAGSALAAGWVLGYMLRKALNAVFTVAGLFLMGVMGLSALGVVSINWDRLFALLSGLAEWMFGMTTEVGQALVASTFGIPALAGFVLGLRYRDNPAPVPFAIRKKGGYRFLEDSDE